MDDTLNESLWHRLNEDIMVEMRAWRVQHPKASLREMETELDARLAYARARMLEDLARHSTAATWPAAHTHQAPACPQCGHSLEERGTHARTLLTQGGQTLALERSYGVCPACLSGLFPPR